MKRALVFVVALAAPSVAHAYPQFQISKESACVSCHLAPAGGGLLEFMGPLTAEEIATWGGNPGFLFGAVDLPEGLFLGGDVRLAAGLHDEGAGGEGAFIPMQGELHGAYKKSGITAYATLGVAIPEEGNAANAILAREHWVMYRTADAADAGFYVRGGRFMPVYGLRYAEHILYTRRYGGTPLYGETYGLSGGYLASKLEVHVTGFIRDRLRTEYALERGDGAALYAETRLSDNAAIGVEARYAKSPDDWRAQGGATGKIWIPSVSLQLAAELQIARQKFDVGEGRNQLIGALIASYQKIKGINIDLALGHYDEDLSIKNLDRDAIDLNVHWFPQSHLELVLMTRYQMIGLGDGGDPSFYALLQAHYRI